MKEFDVYFTISGCFHYVESENEDEARTLIDRHIQEKIQTMSATLGAPLEDAAQEYVTDVIKINE